MTTPQPSDTPRADQWADQWADLRLAASNQIAGRSVDSFIDPYRVFALLARAEQAERQVREIRERLNDGSIEQAIRDELPSDCSLPEWRADNAAKAIRTALSGVSGPTTEGNDDE